MIDEIKSHWQVNLSRKANKSIARLPKSARFALAALISEIEINGPVRGNWPNYGKLSALRHHCHLKKGKPTYVAVWEVPKVGTRAVEVIYAGTHEKAPY